MASTQASVIGVTEGVEMDSAKYLVAPICLPHSPSSFLPTPSSFLPSPDSSIYSPNSSLSFFPTSSSLTAPAWQRDELCGGWGVSIVFPLLLSILGLTGQIWALCYLHSTSPRAAPRTVFHTLLLTLIWTDLIGKLVTTFPVLTSYAMGRWTGGKAMCDYHGFTMVLIALVTHFTVATMAIERFLGICHGYFYSRHITRSSCRYLILSIWVFSSVFSLLPLFDVGQIYLQHPCTWCFANLHLCSDTPVRHRFFTTSLGLINVANLVVIVVGNIMVVGTLLKMRLLRRVPAHLGQSTRSQTDHELQMVVVLVVITVVFTTSWAPLDLILVTNTAWPPHKRSEDHNLELVAVRLASVNQIVDPWAYIICRVMFRSRVWRWCRRGILGRFSSGSDGRGRNWSHRLSSLLNSSKNKAQAPNEPESPTIDPEDTAPPTYPPSATLVRAESVVNHNECLAAIPESEVKMISDGKLDSAIDLRRGSSEPDSSSR